MQRERGITCTHCGGSSPVPADLRTPSFPCAFCGTILSTTAVAGHAAVSADGTIANLREAVTRPVSPEAVARMPVYRERPSHVRAAKCHHCGADVAVPLDLHEKELVCAACQRRQPITLYISDRERFELDMRRQVAANAELARARAEGVPCLSCGASCPVPDDGSIQTRCATCGAVVMLADHVDAGALARRRLMHGVHAIKNELTEQQAARDRKVKVVVALGVVLVLVGAVVIAQLAR